MAQKLLPSSVTVSLEALYQRVSKTGAGSTTAGLWKFRDWTVIPLRIWMAANVGFFIWLITGPFHAMGTTPTGLAAFAAIVAVLYWLLDRYVSNALRGAA